MNAGHALGAAAARGALVTQPVESAIDAPASNSLYARIDLSSLADGLLVSAAIVAE
jgi:hypothetical protein